MNYLISSFNCVLFSQEFFEIKRCVKYKILQTENSCGFIFPFSNKLPFAFSLKNISNNVLKVQIESDNYYLLFQSCYEPSFSTKFNFKTKEVFINLSNLLTITLNGLCICEKDVENLKFSHYEIDGEFCFVYFVGKRNFVAILKGDELCFADYYDECNINENEKYFMRKLHDSLNHGRVCEIKEGKQSTYLVYLDNDEMNLKSEFLPCVFLDCVQAGNIKYLKNLLCEDLCKVESVENFFPEFDMCFQVEEDIVILTKKNTLAGVFKFEIDNCKIVNIIPLQCSFC